METHYHPAWPTADTQLSFILSGTVGKAVGGPKINKRYPLKIVSYSRGGEEGVREEQ